MKENKPLKIPFLVIAKSLRNEKSKIAAERETVLRNASIRLELERTA